MSTYPISKEPFENPRPQLIETEEESIPQEIIESARAAAQRFFDQELPDTQKKTAEWVIEKMLPGMVHIQKAKADVSENEVALFLKDVMQHIDPMMHEVEKINFSRGYELDNYTYPTVQEFKTIASWLDTLKEKYRLYKNTERFILEFRETFQPFLDALRQTVCEKALASRRLQYKKILSIPEDPEFEFKEAVTRAHIHELEHNPKQFLLELRDLLNLSRLPKLKRIPSMEEQRAFQFLFNIV